MPMTYCKRPLYASPARCSDWRTSMTWKPTSSRPLATKLVGASRYDGGLRPGADDRTGLPALVISRLSGARFWLFCSIHNRLAISLIDLIDRYRQKGTRPYAEDILDEKEAPSLVGGMENLFGPLITMLEPSLIAVREPAERTRVMCRSVRVLNALQSRGPATGGQPPRLSDLGLPEATAIDPFNNKPLSTKKLAKAWMVYSVGATLWTTDVFST